MQLYFIRHAQSMNNALWAQSKSDRGRSEDPELTELGIEQARCLAEFLKFGDPKDNSGSSQAGFGITHLYSSLMVRAVMTGTIIANQLGLPLKAWEELHERGGIYLEDEEAGEIRCLPGKDRRFFSENFPDLILPESFRDTGWWDRRPRERPEDCRARARRFLDDLLKIHGGSSDRVAVVSHGGFYNDLLAALLDLNPSRWVWFSMYNAAITRIDFHHDLVELVYQNRVDYLPAELIT